MVADWLERSACNTESMDSTLVRDSYCVGTLSKTHTHNCSVVLLQSAPSIHMSTSELCVQKEEGHKRIEGSCFSFMHSSCLARLKPQLWNQTIICQLLIYTTQFIPHTINY